MATTKRRKSDLDWTDLLLQTISGEPDKVPAGWYTPKQLRDNLKLSRDAVRRRLNKLVASGKIQRKVFKVKNSAGVVAPVAHYGV